MRVEMEGRVPIKMWLQEIEDGAMEQARNLARLPFLVRHVALMPDAHQGYGMPIGGVVATDGVVIPNAVGVDIGCGMVAQPTGLKEMDRETLKAVMGRVRELVPVGFAHQKQAQGETSMPQVEILPGGIVYQQYNAARHQIGTLGGGNHFIEIQRAGDGEIWVMIHSGSRNLGLKVAQAYNEYAKELNRKWCSAVPKEWDLAFLPMDSTKGKWYIQEMQYCVAFALANRQMMMDRVMEAIASEVGDLEPGELINIAHNYAAMENHFGENVMVHRKGATRARDGEVGIIPGSQGSKSYIVRGRGCRESFQSCSHGAGRRMGRKEATRVLSLEEEVARLDALGVVHGMRNVKDLDEAPGAYKDIESVMAQQTELVEIVMELTPIAVVKG